jgi:hypothetical protein
VRQLVDSACGCNVDGWFDTEERNGWGAFTIVI